MAAGCRMTAPSGPLPTTQETGVHPAILQIIGSIQISEATKIMLKEKPLLVGKLQFCDIGNMTFESLFIKAKANCSCSQYF